MRERFGVAELRASLVAYRDLLRDHREAIDRLNVFPIADRDTGTNMARTLEFVVGALDGVPDEPEPTCETVIQAALRGARGNSGVILSQVLRGLCSTLAAEPRAGPVVVAEALVAASVRADHAVLEPVEGTMLTVARESASAAAKASAEGTSVAGVLRAARDAGRVALAATPSQLPVLAAAGVVDAGAAGYVLLLDAMAWVLAGDPLPPLPASVSAQTRALAVCADTEPRYEVMFVCELSEDDVGSLQQRWRELGESITVAGGDGEWTCHVHTNDIGGVIEAALDLGGRPRHIRVADL